MKTHKESIIIYRKMIHQSIKSNKLHFNFWRETFIAKYNYQEIWLTR